MGRPEEKTEENQALRTLLYQALAEPIGLLIATPEPEKLRKRLWMMKQLAEDPELDRVQIANSPVEGGQIVIVKVTREERADPELPKASASLLDL